eukprot:15456980-Alexandrium_andersonii.AAC.1
MSRLTAERMRPLAQDEILRYTPSRLVPDWFPMTHWTLQTLRLRTELGKGEQWNLGHTGSLGFDGARLAQADVLTPEDLIRLWAFS